MSVHRDLVGDQVHVPHAWEYADATARLAASGFIANDAKKLALQLSDNTFWILLTHSPATWTAMGGMPQSVSDHVASTSNPHGVTAAQTGAATAAHNHVGIYEPADANIQSHISSISNPHSVTAAQVGAATAIHNHDTAYEPVGSAAAAVAALIDASPATLNTLNELAAALGDDPNFATTITTSIAAKQATLVSGTNIKTVNGASLLGSGDIVIEGGTGGATVVFPFYKADGSSDAIALIGGSALPFYKSDGNTDNITLVTL